MFYSITLKAAQPQARRSERSAGERHDEEERRGGELEERESSREGKAR